MAAYGCVRGLAVVLLICDCHRRCDIVIHVRGTGEPDLVGRLTGSFCGRQKVGTWGLDKSCRCARVARSVDAEHLLELAHAGHFDGIRRCDKVFATEGEETSHSHSAVGSQLLYRAVCAVPDFG